MDKNQKNEEVSWISDSIKDSRIVVCVDYLGLTVSQVNALRQELRDAGAEVKVSRNTLAKIAAEQVLSDNDPEDIAQFVELFKGPSLLVFGKEDAVASAKIISKYAKEHECFEIKGGWFSDSYLDQPGIVKVSTMPSREEVLGQLLSLINTPATQLVRLVKAPAQQLAQVLGAHQNNL